MTERERIREEERPDSPFFQTDGLPTDEENPGNNTGSYDIAMLSVEELKTINRAAGEIQIAMEEGSDDVPIGVPPPDEPEPPIPDRESAAAGETWS